MASYFSKFKDLLLRRKPVAHSYRHGPANMLGTFTLDKLPPFTLFTADTMLRDPQVKFGLTIRNGGLLQGEVEIKGDNQQEVAFVQRQWDRIWNSHAGLLLRAKRWGYAPFEVTFKPESGKFNKWVGVKDLHFFHPRDARLLVRGGEHAGIRVNRLRDVGQEKILMPSALWVTHQADTGNRYGMSINFDAYSPWWEKWMERGAKDVLRLRMIKDAYSGDVFKVPMELVEDKDGNQIPYMDLIREAIEARLAGSPLFLPNLTDENGNSLIEYTPPSDNGRPDGILEWAERLDWDIWKGQGVVREVVEAATSGSGYSGRSIPMTTFLTALGEELKEVVHCVDRDVLRPLTHINMGREPSYEIYPKSLVETFADDMGNSGMGGESMGGTQSQQRGSDGNGQWIPQQGVRGGQRWMNTQTQQVTYRPPAQFAEDTNGHQYSCLMGRFHPDVAAKVWNISQRIADDDLAEDGRENWPHLTLLYGIHSNEPDQVKHLLRNQGPIALRFGGYGVFENPEGDVLYLSVESMTVYQIRQKLEEAIPNTQTHPDYIPHVTLAYLKSGAAKKYLDNPWLLGQPHPPEMGVVGIEELEFSNQFDQRFPIFLRGDVIQFAEFDPAKHPRDEEGRFTDTKGKTHSIGLPKNKKRMTIDQAGAALKEMGYELGKGDYDLHTRETKYLVTDGAGRKMWLNAQDLREMVYRTASVQFAEEADGAEDALRPFLITADRWIRKSIREIMDEIRESAGSNIARPSLLVEITAIISRLRQRVRRGLAESMVAAGLYGMHSVAMDVAEHMPPPPTGDTSVPPSSPPPPTEFPAPLDGDDEPEIRFPIVDKMLTDMRDSPVFNDTDYRAVAQQVHDGAFAVTGDLEAKTVEDIRNTLVENLERGPDAKRFVDDVQEVLINSDGLSENHLHTVFRTNMQTAVSDSMERALHKPLVVDFFQYRAYFATSDERTRDTHRALEKLGLNGTNIYNKDDPVWQEFRAPWDYNCRCSWAPVTVRDAANRGVVEAQEWWARAEAMADERGGRPANYLSETAPQSFEFVPHPPFSAPPEFERR